MGVPLVTVLHKKLLFLLLRLGTFRTYFQNSILTLFIARSMSYKTIHALTVGTGLVLGSCFEKWRVNFFKITAQTNEELNELDQNAPYLTYGYPVRDVILQNDKDFIISYDQRFRIPNWVYEKISLKYFSGDEKEFISKLTEIDLDPERRYIKPDGRVMQRFRVISEDYENSAFIPGFVAPASNHETSEKIQLSTNAVPQAELLNIYAWIDFNNHIQKTLWHQCKYVHILTGPLFLPRKTYLDGCEETDKVEYQLIGDHRVAVPTHFFKVVALEALDHTLRFGSMIIPNEKINFDHSLEEYFTFLDEVEKLCGFRIFSPKDEDETIPQSLLTYGFFPRRKSTNLKHINAPESTELTPRQGRFLEHERQLDIQEEMWIDVLNEKDEKKRVAAEETRKIQELDRQAKENNRKNNDVNRSSNRTSREESEQKTKESEKSREETEENGQKKDEQRMNNEVERKNNELERKDSKKKRKNSENEKNNKEQLRHDGEECRAEMEVLRTLNETNKVKTNRANNENKKLENEMVGQKSC